MIFPLYILSWIYLYEYIHTYKILFPLKKYGDHFIIIMNEHKFLPKNEYKFLLKMSSGMNYCAVQLIKLYWSGTIDNKLACLLLYIIYVCIPNVRVRGAEQKSLLDIHDGNWKYPLDVLVTSSKYLLEIHSSGFYMFESSGLTAVT